VAPKGSRFVRRQFLALFGLSLISLCLWLGCRQGGIIRTPNATRVGPEIDANLLPVSVDKNDLHPAGTYWLASGDAAEILNPQTYTFGLTDASDPTKTFTCTFTPSTASCGDNVPINITFGVDVLACPGQSADCNNPNSGASVIDSFPLPLQNGALLQLDHQQFKILNEDATYGLRATATWGDMFNGSPVSQIKVNVVPAGMMGRTFTAALVFGTRPSGEKWAWAEDPGMWTENFGSSLQVTDISVSKDGQPIPFCGVTFQNHNCGCAGNEMLSSSCQTVDLTKCTSLNGLVITPTYILNGVNDRLSSPDGSMEWRARFAANGCGLTPPPQGTNLTINFTVVAR
jgi:hypothetical protein